MNTSTYLILAFGLGMIFKSLIVLKLSKKYLYSLLALPFTIIVVYIKSEGDLNLSLLGGIFATTFVLAITFSNHLLQKVSERELLIFTLIFIYSLFTFFTPDASDILFLILINIPSYLMLILSFMNIVLPFLLKLFLYTWFLLLNIYLTWIFLFKGPIINIFTTKELSYANLFSSGLLGFNLFFLVVNLTYIYLLVPLPGKHQSFKEKWQQVKEFSGILVSKHSDRQLQSLETLFILAFFGGFLGLNYFYTMVEHTTIILLCLTLIQINFFNILHRAKDPAH